MTCYQCGRQPGDTCRKENGCTASDAPFHSSQPKRYAPRTITAKEARQRINGGQPVYAEYHQAEGQVRRRVFRMTDHGDEVTLEHGPSERRRLAWNRINLTKD